MQGNERRLFHEEMFDPSVDDYHVVAEACLDGQGDRVSDERTGILPLLVHPPDRRHSDRLEPCTLKRLTGRPIGDPLSCGLHNGLSHIRRSDQPCA